MIPESEWSVGDVVSRDGTDEHRIVDINDAGDLIEVECIKPPSSGWTYVGDKEWNLGRRYEWLRRDVK